MPNQPPFDAALLDRLPTVLAVPLHQFATAREPEQRLHRLCDAAEVLTRFCTVLAVAEARARDTRHRLPEPLVKVLGPTIQTPTFARWLGMARDLGEFLAAERTSPPVLQELPQFIREVLLKTAPPGNRFLDGSLVELRNTLAHGGAMSADLANYLLHGDPTGLPRGAQPSVPGEADAEEAPEAPAEPPPGPTAFPGWEAVLGDAVTALADLLQGSRLCSFDGEAARLLLGREPAGDEVPLSADLRLAFREMKLHGHVLLLREGRWLDLWPLCDHGKARLASLRGPIESEGDAPLLYYRGEPQRLLYAAFGTTPPVSERGDAVADFEALFRPTPRKGTAPEIALDFTEELRRDSLQLVGRATELQDVKEALGRTTSGVLWLSGTGGIGKSFLTARVAVNHGNDPRRWCCIPWRFRVSDADRSNPSAFLRHAITRLARWPALGRADVRPELDSNKLPTQLDELLRAAGRLQPAGKNPRPPRVLIVLDGMDEAARLSPDLLEWPFRFVHPNVVWLCSGRPDQATDKAFAAGRCTHLFRCGLPAMSSGDVRALLYQELGEQRYELLGLDRRDAAGNVTNPLVEAIVAKSEGLPLYIRFLVEDLLTGHFELTGRPELTGRLKSKLPQGLAAYYEDLLERTGIDDVQGMLPKLLAAVVWAQGPVAAELLFELLRRLENVSPDEEERLRADIQQGLQRVGSMVRLAPLPEGGLGYEPYHTTLGDHFRASTTRLGRTNSRAREVFVALTKDWRRIAGAAARRYVFRHGPQHLLDEKRHDDLYALARDEAFLRTQAEELPGEPEAPLRTLRAALIAAGRRDDAAGMVEFLLRHAEQTQGLQNESPLAALRHGNLDRALALAHLADGERSVVHYLLLAWELLDRDRGAEARQVLNQLGQRKLPKLGEGCGSAAGWILARLSRSYPAAVTELARRVLGEDQLVQLVEALIGQGLLALADSMTGCLMGGRARSGLLAKLAAARERAGQAEAARLDFKQALQTTRTIEDPFGRFDALRDIAVALVLAGQAEAALQVPRALKNPFWRCAILGAIAVAQARADHADESRLTFEQALQAARTVQRLDWRSEALADVAAAQAEAGQAEAGRLTLEQALEAAGAIEDPDRRSRALRNVAAAQAGAGQTREAHLTFEAALQAAHAIDDPGLRSEALEDVAVARARAARAEATLQTAGAIERPSGRSAALPDIASIQAEGNQAEAARFRFEQALQTTRALACPDWRCDALWAIAATQVRAGDAEAALRAAAAIEDPDKRSQALKDVAEARAQAGQAEAAIQDARAIEHPYWRSEALGNISAAQAWAGRADAALQAARAIDDPDGRAGALRVVAATQARAGQAEAARLTFDAALQAARAIENPSTRSEALGRIAATQAGAGQAQAALQTARAIESPYRRTEALGRIAAAQALAGDAGASRLTFEQALQAARAIQRLDWRSEALQDVAVAQEEAGQAEAALQAAHAIEDPHRRSWALRDIAAAQAREGQAEAARLTFDAALQAARAIDDPGGRSRALRDVAEAQEEAGQAGAARLTFEAALQAARAIDDPDGRSEALGTIAVAHARAGDAEAALQAAYAIEDPDRRSGPLRDVAAAHAWAGQVEAALQAARAIENPDRRSEAWEHLVEAQARAGQAAAAIHTACAIEGPDRRAEALRSLGAKLVGAAHSGPVAQAISQEVLQAMSAVSSEQERAGLLESVAHIHVRSGLADQAIATARLILVEREKHLPAIVKSFLEARDRTAFKELLLSCAGHLQSAWEVCGLLARAYPEQATAIAQVVLQLGRATA
jgi:hypothetical protein